MKFRMILFAALLTALLILPPAAAEETQTGHVSLPLERYNNLVDAGRKPEKEPREAPAQYALGQCHIEVNVDEVDEKASARITAALDIKVLEDDWVAVPILPAGTAIQSAAIGGSSVSLITTSSGLAWGVKKSGSYKMTLVYHADAQRYETGYALAVPVPEAAAISFSAAITGTGIDPTVIPSSGTTIDAEGPTTRIKASIPTTSGIQLNWRVPRKEGHVISRAEYKGTQVDDSVTWNGTFDVELFNDETLTLQVLPQSVTLREILVDGKEANVIVENEHFATLVKGRGAHEIQVSFQVPIERDDGPPSVSFTIPAIPISLFELSLEGKKEVEVDPPSNVESVLSEDTTSLKVYVPMTEMVEFTWKEAVPEEVKAEARANALLYHAVHAEEGVLYVHAIAEYQVTRGELNIIEMELPQGIAVNQVESPRRVIADWRVSRSDDTGTQLLSIFLDRKIDDNIRLDVHYDRSIVGKAAKEQLEIPLLRALKVNRQRGMAALLSTKELTLKPLKEERITKVGENQLPAHVKQGMAMTIAHTYKYVEDSPKLVVRATEPEKKRGKFDALVHTLISLGDVTVKGSATCEVNVKSGKITDLRLHLPKNANFLNLTGPSIRTHKVNSLPSHQEVEVQFTQEMEGQFRLEAAYERIISEGESTFDVPTLQVDGAEARTGFVAVEALSAVEVQPAEVAHLTSMQSNELPQQLVLKTTNPILLAYKYVTVPYTLQLKVTRHRVIDVQAAAIDAARYTTLFVKDGLAITRAEFVVRNSRKQFLRVHLPGNSTVWSVLVNGKPEKPAIAEIAGDEKKGSGSDVLIKVINSTQGFPVSLVYQTNVPKIENFGSIEGVLPRPDMAATNTRWEVFLPDDLDYLNLDTNMDIVEEGSIYPRHRIQDELRAAGRRQSVQSSSPMHIDVPTGGVRYVFEKLYANKAEDDAFFSLYYISENGRIGGIALVVLATLLLWSGLLGMVKELDWLPGSRAKAAAGAGLLVLAVVLGYLEFKTGWRWAVWISIVVLCVVIAALLAGLWSRRKEAEFDEAAPDADSSEQEESGTQIE